MESLVTTWRFDHPPALVIAEGKHVEIIDLKRWRRITIENRLACEFLKCMKPMDAGSTPLLEALRAIGDPSHDILFALLGQKQKLPFATETLFPVPPWQIWLELTSQCNEQCLHCYADSGPWRNQHMDRALAFRVVREAARMGFRTIQFTGGDPLLCPFIVELVAEAAEMGIPTREVFTNGLLLKDDLFEELLCLNTLFAISFYSHRAEVHDRITRVPGSHRRTLGAIQRLVEVGAPVRVGVIVMDQNKHDLQMTCELLKSVGVSRKRICVDRIHSVGRGIPLGESEMGAGPHGDFGAASARPHGITEGNDEPSGAELPRRGKIMVAPDGTVYPCIFQRWLPLGNLHAESLEAVYSKHMGPGTMEPARAFQMCCEKIACSDCRVTAYLGTRAPARDIR